LSRKFESNLSVLLQKRVFRTLNKNDLVQVGWCYIRTNFN